MNDTGTALPSVRSSLIVEQDAVLVNAAHEGSDGLSSCTSAAGDAPAKARPSACPLGHAQGPALARASDLLRGILDKNPDIERFTVERLLASIGASRLETSLVVFAIPTLVPVPRPWGMSALSTGAIGCQLATGQLSVKLPRFIRRKSISRRALAAALHLLLPVIEAAEKLMRPRWSWANTPLARRAVGVFVFLLAVAIAHPLLGFGPLHATSIALMSLGMVEQDGLVVVIGAAVGALSLAIVAGTGISGRALRGKVAAWLRKGARKLGVDAFAAFLKRRGYERLARVVRLQWSDLLLLWPPERVEAGPSAPSRAVSVAARRSRRTTARRSEVTAAKASQPLRAA